MPINSPSRRTVLALGAGFAATGFLAAPARAASPWPRDKPVRLVVSAAAGGSLDILARPLAQVMSELSGGRFIVENLGGAAGMIGASNVVKSAPDGYSFLVGGVHHMIMPVAYPNMPYETDKDLLPIGLIATVPNVVLVGKSSPLRSIQDLIAAARSAPHGLNYGTGGRGGLHHLSTEHFKSLTGAPMQAIHYKGSAPAIADLLGGQLDVMFETMPNALGQLRSGALRALAVTSAQRSPQLPDVPTLAEAGVPDLVTNTWYGVFAPAQLPAEIEVGMQALMRRALASEQLQRTWKDYGASVSGPGAQDFKAYTTSELHHWRELSRRVGFKPGD